MVGTKPYRFRGLGANAVSKSFDFIRFGALVVASPYNFIDLGAMAVTKPYKFIGFGALHCGPRSLGSSPLGLHDSPGDRVYCHLVVVFPYCA